MDNEMTQAVKKQLLLALHQALAAGTVTREEILLAIGSSPQTAASAPQAQVPAEKSTPAAKMNVVQALQYIGGFIVLLGIGTFVSTFWSDIAPMTRVLIVSGGAILFYILGVILIRVDTKSQSGVAFHLIAGCLFPFAFYVALNELFAVEITSQVIMTISIVLLAIYGASYAVFRHPIFTFFTLAAGISLIYSSINVLLPGISSETLAHLTFIIGAIGIYTGYSFRGTENAPLSGLMYFLGSVAVLAAPAWNFNSFPLWQLLYPVLLAGMLYVALVVHSKRIMTVSVLALMCYVVYLTGKYFADVIGWPIALVVTGILLIAIGYGAVKYKEHI